MIAREPHTLVDANREQLAKERAEQGLPATITDPTVLAQLAASFAASNENGARAVKPKPASGLQSA